MGAMSRRKGKVAELAACKALEPAFGSMHRVIGQERRGGDAPDVDGTDCPFAVEVKNQATLYIPAWWSQACGVAELDGRPPMLTFKLRGEWLVTIRARDLGRIVGRG